MISKNVTDLSVILNTIGLTAMEEGDNNKDAQLLRLGNMTAMLGHIAQDEELLIEFDIFVGYFSAQKILDNTTPKHLMLAKTLTEMSEKNPDIAEFLDGFITGEFDDDSDGCETCNDCEIKDDCENYKPSEPIIKPEEPKQKINKIKTKKRGEVKKKSPKQKPGDENSEEIK
jgi:hypothetical protein